MGQNRDLAGAGVMTENVPTGRQGGREAGPGRPYPGPAPQGLNADTYTASASRGVGRGHHPPKEVRAGPDQRIGGPGDTLSSPSSGHRAGHCTGNERCSLWVARMSHGD